MKHERNSRIFQLNPDQNPINTNNTDWKKKKIQKDQSDDTIIAVRSSIGF